MTTLRPPAIVINNATLRDVEQMAPLTFSHAERADLARELEAMGTGEIELAMPSAEGDGTDGLASVAAALTRARPILWGPASRHIVDSAVRSGIGSVCLSLKMSARHAGRATGLERMRRLVGYARDRGLRVALCGEDTSRANFDVIREIIAVAEAACAERFRVTDTAGVLHPSRTHALFRELCAETDLELEFRGHDDFGFATANTIAAVEGGATHVSVSLVKLAGRSHAAQLEDVVGAIRISTLHPVDIDLTRVPMLVSRIADLLGLPAGTRRRPAHPGDARERWVASGAEG